MHEPRARQVLRLGRPLGARARRRGEEREEGEDGEVPEERGRRGLPVREERRRCEAREGREPERHRAERPVGVAEDDGQRRRQVRGRVERALDPGARLRLLDARQLERGGRDRDSSLTGGGATLRGVTHDGALRTGGGSAPRGRHPGR